MPKKPPRNGYYFFMQDYKIREEKLGRKFPGGLKDVANAASAEWNSLSKNQKDYYNAIAKERKNEPRRNAEKKVKCNSQGISLAEIERIEKEKERKLAETDTFIKSFINEMSLEDIKNKMMYLIHVNYFCKTDHDVYYPAELAVVKFNLKQGVRGLFHRYIDPGEIATGYSYELKEHSEKTHKLTLQFVRSIENANDLSRMYKELCEFLQEDDKIPPLFTLYDDVFHNTSITAVKKTLQHLFEYAYSYYKDDDHWEKIFKVYPLSPMFAKLKNRCCSYKQPGIDAFPNHILALNELQIDTYNFDIKMACNFHQEEDNISYCSRSYVLRWVSIIRDHCCMFLDINIIENEIDSSSFFDSDTYDEDNNDCKSEFSSYSASTCLTEKSVGFSAVNKTIKKEKDFYSDNVRIKKENDDIKSNIKKENYDHFKKEAGKEKLYDYQEPCTSTTLNPIIWPHGNYKKEETVPSFSEDNFPALKLDRRSTRGIKNKLKNLNFQDNE